MAVARVVLNRVAAQSWYGATVRDVIIKPWQFSWFNDLPLEAPFVEPTSQIGIVARLAIAGLLTDDTGGATHYHATWLEPYPDWARNMKVTTTIGQHIFYR